MATEDKSAHPINPVIPLGPVWYLTRTHFQVILGDMLPSGRLGKFRRWLVLRLWPELSEPRAVVGMMEYTLARKAD